MENIPRSTQCVQQHLSSSSQFFTAEELAPPAEPKREARSPRPPATSCEACGEPGPDLFGLYGGVHCADCAAKLSAEEWS